eukprot:bmy_15498T0
MSQHALWSLRVAWCVQCFGDLSCCVRGLRPLSPSGLPVTAQGLWAKRVEGPSSSPYLCGAGAWGGRMRSFVGPANLSIWETGGELVLFGRKWISQLGWVLGGRDPSESMKEVLGFQVRSSGAPGPLTLKEVEELEQLTQQLMQDMEHPQRQNVAVSESCGRCHQPLARAQPAVRALGQLFHITCFTCHQCERQLQGQQFYSLEGAPYCEGCYTDTLEKCNTCGQPITDRMLRATGKAYHPQCFTCVVCACPLEGTSFIVDQANRPHCVPDYHK